MKIKVYSDTDHTGVYGRIYLSPMHADGRAAGRDVIPPHILHMDVVSEQFPRGVPNAAVAEVEAAFRAAGWTVLD